MIFEIFFHIIIFQDIPASSDLQDAARILISLLASGAGGAVFVGLLKFIEYLRTEKRNAQTQKTQFELDREKLMFATSVDVKTLTAENQQKIFDQLSNFANSLLARLDDQENTRVVQRENARKREDELEKTVDSLKLELEEMLIKITSITSLLHSTKTVSQQYRERHKFVCDEAKIAFWAMLPDGSFECNQTFLDITGFESVHECKDDGWFAAIEESHRLSAKTRWKQFTVNHVTRPIIEIVFKNVRSQETVKTKVFCEPIMSDGMTVYEFTARTSPIRETLD